jgi:dsDNA-specific endonuclease/ATPase MutS2
MRRVDEDEPLDAIDPEAGDTIEIPITDTLDLHPFRPKEVRDVAREYLVEAHARGFTQVRLIHGRGIGVQREGIRTLLGSLDFVTDFHDADPSGGGWGSTVVLLAPNPQVPPNEE